MLPEKISILVVDDDPAILFLIKEALEPEGYNIITAGDGLTALRLFKENPPSLVLLDIKIPIIDGYAVFRGIRNLSQIPVIFITGVNTSEKEEVIGLDIGADDYITKPFSCEKLAARIRAVLRRSLLWERHANQSPFQCHELKIDFDRKVVTLKNEHINLTATEYLLLSCLADHANQIISASEILKEVWGEQYIHDIHLVQVNIGRLRRKLNDTKGLKYIETKSGLGYILNN